MTKQQRVVYHHNEQTGEGKCYLQDPETGALTPVPEADFSAISTKGLNRYEFTKWHHLGGIDGTFIIEAKTAEDATFLAERELSTSRQYDPKTDKTFPTHTICRIRALP